MQFCDERLLDLGPELSRFLACVHRRKFTKRQGDAARQTSCTKCPRNIVNASACILATVVGRVNCERNAGRNFRLTQVGHLQSATEHELYSDKGPIADRHEHPARTSSMGHASDIKRSIYLHRQRQLTMMTLRAMGGGRTMKRTHSVRRSRCGLMLELHGTLCNPPLPSCLDAMFSSCFACEGIL